MCTALRYGSLFGRTLDLEYDLGQTPTVMHGNGYDILGMAITRNGHRLFFDGVNSRGLAGAALNFEGCACYRALGHGTPIPSYELLPRTLLCCATVDEAEEMLKEVNITNDDFSSELKSTPLHFAFADKCRSIAVEQTQSGMTVYKNPTDVLTNSPEFPVQMLNLTNYISLSARPPKNTLCPELDLTPYCRGMGAIGLPGDCSSPSRFVRAAFNLKNAAMVDDADSATEQFFHICDSVSQIKGCNLLDNGMQVYTIYSVCYDLINISLSLTAYNDRSIKRHHLK